MPSSSGSRSSSRPRAGGGGGASGLVDELAAVRVRRPGRAERRARSAIRRSSSSGASPAPATSRSRSSSTSTERGTLGVHDYTVTPPPEGHRGIGVAGAHPGQERRRSRWRRPDRSRAGTARAPSSSCTRRQPHRLVPRGEHPAPGRAHGHGDDDGRGPRQAAAARIAAGELLDGDPPPSFGHAIEARLNAEDPQQGFTPAPGASTTSSSPTGPASASTPVWPPATSSPPSTTPWWRR